MKKISLSEYQVALVDFDGTLVDSEFFHYRAYRELLERNGCYMPWDLTTYWTFAHSPNQLLMSTELYRLFPQMQERFPTWNLLRLAKNQIFHSLITSEPVSLIRGAEELLKSLFRAGLTVVIVTNSTQEQVQAISSHYPIFRRIDGWVTVDQYQQRKPHPESYLLAIKRYCQPGDRTIGFEDSARGLTALQQAGVDLPVWLVTPGYQGDLSFLAPRTLCVHTLEGIFDLDEEEAMSGCSHRGGPSIAEG